MHLSLTGWYWQVGADSCQWLLDLNAASRLLQRPRTLMQRPWFRPHFGHFDSFFCDFCYLFFVHSEVWVLYWLPRAKKHQKQQQKISKCKVMVLTTHPLLGSNLTQKLTVIGRFWCSKSTFYRSLLKNNKNNNFKTRFSFSSPLATTLFPTLRCHQLTVKQGYKRGKQHQET